MHYWMIRYGKCGTFFDEFIKSDVVAIGRGKIGGKYGFVVFK
jgi:hypothetical protein